MTLISSYASDGECLGRCDARCHDADSPPGTCDCICGGMNHGVGLAKARENTQKHCDEWVEEMKRKHGEYTTTQATLDALQGNLF